MQTGFGKKLFLGCLLATGVIPAMAADQAMQPVGIIGAPAGTGAWGSALAVVMGDARVEENLVLQLVEAPSSVLEGDEVGIVVRVRLAGAREPREVRVVLEELDKEGARVVVADRKSVV